MKTYFCVLQPANGNFMKDNKKFINLMYKYKKLYYFVYYKNISIVYKVQILQVSYRYIISTYYRKSAQYTYMVNTVKRVTPFVNIVKRVHRVHRRSLIIGICC